jgi:hypothetical protein
MSKHAAVVTAARRVARRAAVRRAAVRRAAVRWQVLRRAGCSAGEWFGGWVVRWASCPMGRLFDRGLSGGQLVRGQLVRRVGCPPGGLSDGPAVRRRVVRWVGCSTGGVSDGCAVQRVGCSTARRSRVVTRQAVLDGWCSTGGHLTGGARRAVTWRGVLGGCLAAGRSAGGHPRSTGGHLAGGHPAGGARRAVLDGRPGACPGRPRELTPSRAGARSSASLAVRRSCPRATGTRLRTCPGIACYACARTP